MCSLLVLPCSVKTVVFSRAYIHFLTSEDVYDFKARFDGHVFVSNRGNQYKCAVEYAPFQKVPAPDAKKHPLEGTIEQGAIPGGCCCSWHGSAT